MGQIYLSYLVVRSRYRCFGLRYDFSLLSILSYHEDKISYHTAHTFYGADHVGGTMCYVPSGSRERV